LFLVLAIVGIIIQASTYRRVPVPVTRE